ncbi:MAG TPA: hypothetical protein VN081_02880, partial [Dongiaceae bacterium]|nr:hypothetical protein [Dongiaceae bacterium]
VATTAPTVSEDVTNPGTPEEQSVPFSRFQEVNNGLKEEREARAQLEERLAAIEAAGNTPNDQEIDEDVKKILDTYAKQSGLVSKADLEAVQKEAELKLQVQQDIADLTKELNGFDYNKVMEHAKEAGLSINSKADLKSAFINMNYANDIENAKKAAIAEFQESGRTTGELSSTGTPQPTNEEQVQGVKSRIALTRQKLGI